MTSEDVKIAEFISADEFRVLASSGLNVEISAGVSQMLITTWKDSEPAPWNGARFHYWHYWDGRLYNRQMHVLDVEFTKRVLEIVNWMAPGADRGSEERIVVVAERDGDIGVHLWNERFGGTFNKKAARLAAFGRMSMATRKCTCRGCKETFVLPASAPIVCGVCGSKDVVKRVG